MTRLLQIFALAGISCFTMSTVSAQSKEAPKDKLGEFDEIVIKHKSNKDGKVTVEIRDGDILVDGKKIDQYDDPDISVFRRKITPRDGNVFSFDSNNPQDRFNLFNDEGDDSAPVTMNKAILGVITEKTGAAGVTVKSVAKGTPADKAGIKTGDVITAIDNENINEPAQLFEIIGKHQPGDKITVTYTRNSKSTKAAVTLDERKDLGGGSFGTYPAVPGFPKSGPRSFTFPSPRGRQGFGDGWFNYEDNGVKLGLQVQDTENGDGARVIDIAEGSPAASAGFMKNDVVQELGGAAVKSASDLARAYRENRSKGILQAKVNRNGSLKTIDIKIPKKLNKADI
ncbi:PDZ domain-containing protein [Chitinophaga sp. 212800008-4]|uniref:PDZ domain-containing protein n=1 Tax=Chitinophaga sp. 212800008-4 TaxID=3108349 RepID=UPI0030CC368A